MLNNTLCSAPFRVLTLVAVFVFAHVSTHALDKMNTALIDSVFAEYNKPDVPGCVVAVYRNDEILYMNSYGAADLENSVPLTTKSAFCIASTSKQFTAASILLLAQQGKLSLDDDIRKHLPEIPDYGHRITIQHLLNHTSGIRDFIGLLIMSGVDYDDVATVQDAMRIITLQRSLDFEPGTKSRYSNSGYFLAGMIVQRISGKPLRTFARENIFEPLGMANTNFIDDHTEIVPRRASAYTPRREGGFQRDMSYWEPDGSGGVYTTVEDLLKWDRNFYTPRVGGAALNTELMRRTILKDGDTLSYAAGLYYDTFEGMETVEHNGSRAGYRSSFIRIPSKHLSVVVLSNNASTDPDELGRKVLGIILTDHLPKTPAQPDVPVQSSPGQPVAVEIDPTVFDAYAGTYEFDEMPGFALTFSREGNTFLSQATGQDQLEIFPSSDSTFFLKVVEASLTFHRAADGTVSRLTLHQQGDHQAKRITTVPPPTAEELAGYAGRYFSPELESTYTLTVENGVLIAKHPQLETAKLAPLPSEPGFSGDQWYLGKVFFEKDDKGTARAMLVSGGRLKNLRFEKQ